MLERDIGRKIARYAILGLVVASGSIATPAQTEARSLLSRTSWQSIVSSIRPQLAQCGPLPTEGPPPPDQPIEPGVTPTPTDRFCVQVITKACPPDSVDPADCKDFPTPCDVPEGWRGVQPPRGRSGD